MKLLRQFYTAPTLSVAPDLLGKFLVVKTKKSVRNNSSKLAGMIVETEAYIGQDDLACHAAHGMTKRNEVMFGEAGYAYVYMIYGMYYCLNVVTERAGFPAAVLIRALEPKEGLEKMAKNRGFSKKDAEILNLTNGPGKLCQALGIDRKLNGADLLGNKIWIEDRKIKIRKNEIVRTQRIGVEYAGHCKNYPWRFYIKGNRFISLR